ncbi:50S ribosomal protein L22 [Candidatus Woesearchaeota archaeon]|nr:50S ribosomal protein L22 [Candidatus Woesearchaeota archaeon]
MANEHIAKVIGRNLPISKKHSVEICKFIRGKSVERSRDMLAKVMQQEMAVPFGTFNRDTGHRKGGVGPGRYPNKASKFFIELLNSLEANATHKGLDSNSLFIKSIMANKGSTIWHPGRLGRRRMRTTNVEIIAAEREIKEKKEGRK